jgi:hypothetical protein
MPIFFVWTSHDRFEDDAATIWNVILKTLKILLTKEYYYPGANVINLFLSVNYRFL